MTVICVLVAVVVLAFAFVGFVAIRMAGLVSRDERAGLIPTRKDQR